MTKTVPVTLIAVAILAGCTSQVQQERSALLAKPINCATAADDISALSGVIPGSGERLSSGVRLVLPASLVTGAATGQLGTRSDVASGTTEDQIRARIAEIDAQCDTVEIIYQSEDPV